MIISRKGHPVLPAAEDKDRVFHEIKQCLRLTGVPDYFKAWAESPGFLARVWEAAGPNAETRAFEEAADRLRAEAVKTADGLGRLSALGPARLGESQAYQAQAALMLYHYAYPKLLLLNASLLAAQAPERGARRPEGSPERVERGAAAGMAMLETVDERGAEPFVARVLRDCRKSSGGERVDGLWGTLALWPAYLDAAWERLREAAAEPAYGRGIEELGESARALAAALPFPAVIPGEGLRPGEEALMSAQAERFDRTLAGLALSVAWLALDWQAPEILRRSPFPAGARAA